MTKRAATADQIKPNVIAASGCLLLLVLVALVGMCTFGGASKPSGDPKADIRKLYSDVVAATSACDTQTTATIDGIRVRDALSSYQSAIDAKAACSEAFGQIDRLHMPQSFDADLANSVRKGKDACGYAMLAKSEMMGQLGKILDDGSKLSSLASLKSSANDAAISVSACFVAFQTAATKLGVKLPDQ